jgi:hypothetical protein
MVIGYLLWQVDRYKIKVETKEAEITRLSQDQAVLESNLQEAIRVNLSNEKFLMENAEQARKLQAVAMAELQAYKSRDIQLRSILDELNSIPQEERSSVSPIVCRTVDRLYESAGPSAPACGS